MLKKMKTKYQENRQKIAGLIKITWYLTNHKIFSQLSSGRTVESCTSSEGDPAGILPRDSLRTNLFNSNEALQSYQNILYRLLLSAPSQLHVAMAHQYPGILIINGSCTSPHIWLHFPWWSKTLQCSPALLWQQNNPQARCSPAPLSSLQG